MKNRPSWTPNVTVAGIGDTGVENVGQFQTVAPAQILEDPSPVEIREDIDFLILSTDLREPETRQRVSSILHGTQPAVTVFFAEGLTETPENLMQEINLLIPVRLDTVPREFYTPFIADLFEAMLPMTVEDLGKGEIREVAGENRIGKLYLDTPNNEENPGVDLTPEVRYESPEYILFFHCSGEKQPPGKVQEKIDEYQFSKDIPVIWDQRVHPRYIGRPHTKYLITFDADEENIYWNREKKGMRDTGWDVQDNQFIERKED